MARPEEELARRLAQLTERAEAEAAKRAAAADERLAAFLQRLGHAEERLARAEATPEVAKRLDALEERVANFGARLDVLEAASPRLAALEKRVDACGLDVAFVTPDQVKDLAATAADTELRVVEDYYRLGVRFIAGTTLRVSDYRDLHGYVTLGLKLRPARAATLEGLAKQGRAELAELEERITRARHALRE